MVFGNALGSCLKDWSEILQKPYFQLSPGLIFWKFIEIGWIFGKFLRLAQVESSVQKLVERRLS